LRGGGCGISPQPRRTRPGGALPVSSRQAFIRVKQYNENRS